MPASPPAPSEMLSGPDLGGGFLHQLSIDRLGEATTFTHHAQDGGDDAGGPPIGSLEPLGFVHPAAPCMFGGPRCWHRRYLLPFAGTGRVRAAYARHRFVLETMLRQLYAGAPVPFESGFRELVGRIAGPLRSEGIPWYIGGSAGVTLAGGGGTPNDIDLGTSRAGVDRLGTLLAEYLVEPVAPTDWPPGERLVVGARAFVGSPRDGLRVEWSVPLEERTDLRWPEFSGVPGAARTACVNFEGTEIEVSRPEYAMVRAQERHRPAALDAALRAAVRLGGSDRELLEVLLAQSALSAGDRAALRRAADPSSRPAGGSAGAAPS